MIGTYVLYTLLFGLSAFMLYAFTQYGKPVQLIVGPVTFGATPMTFGGTPMDSTVNSRPSRELALRCIRPGEGGRVAEVRRTRDSLSITVAAGAHVSIG